MAYIRGVYTYVPSAEPVENFESVKELQGYGVYEHVDDDLKDCCDEVAEEREDDQGLAAKVIGQRACDQGE